MFLGKYRNEIPGMETTFISYSRPPVLHHHDCYECGAIWQHDASHCSNITGLLCDRCMGKSRSEKRASKRSTLTPAPTHYLLPDYAEADEVLTI